MSTTCKHWHFPHSVSSQPTAARWFGRICPGLKLIHPSSVLCVRPSWPQMSTKAWPWTRWGWYGAWGLRYRDPLRLLWKFDSSSQGEESLSLHREGGGNYLECAGWDKREMTTHRCLKTKPVAQEGTEGENKIMTQYTTAIKNDQQKRSGTFLGLNFIQIWINEWLWEGRVWSGVFPNGFI